MPTILVCFHRFVLCAALAIAATALPAQCVPNLLDVGTTATNGSVRAMTHWDADGPGGNPPALVIGGSFTQVGTTAASNIAWQHPVTGVWSPLGGGVSGGGFPEGVFALTVDDATGDLWVGGVFTNVGTGTANAAGLARWNGSWDTSCGGITGPPPAPFQGPAVVRALRCDGSGNLVIGGYFIGVGPSGSAIAAQGVARMNLSTLAWSTMPGGPSDVYALVQLPNGRIVAGGAGLKSWDGAAWSTIGPNPFAVAALAVRSNGDLYIGTASGLFRWDGTNYQPLGMNPNGPVQSLLPLPNGDILAGGYFTTAGGVPCNGVARWSGGFWSAMGFDLPTNAQVLALGVDGPSAQFLAVGDFAGGLRRWTGTDWGSTYGTNWWVWGTKQLANGDLVAFGAFHNVHGVACNGIARRTPAGWTPLGSGVLPIYCVVELPNGDLIVGGAFTTAGGVAANNVARWSGTAWSPLGAGVPSQVDAMARLANGDLVVAYATSWTTSNVSRWNGSSWSSMGSVAGVPRRALLMPNGDLMLAMGNVSPAPNGYVHRWDGTQWTQILAVGLSAGYPSVTDLELTATGELLAAGAFTTANGTPCSGVVRWTGGSGPGSWVSLGPASSSSIATQLERLPTGQLLAVGNGCWTWNGSSWSSLGITIDYGGVYGAEVLADGSFTLAGNFSLVSGRHAKNLMSVTSGCAASALAQGPGCSGSGGANLLLARAAPWLGGTAVATATGLPSTGLAIHVLGLASVSVPLVSIVPQGQPGCALLVQPDAIALLLPTAGQVTLSLPIPAGLSPPGALLHQQVVALALDGSGAITEVTSTNALQLSLGSW